MKRIESSIVLGMVLIGVGVLFLLQNMGVIGAIAGLVWAVFFAAGGGAFLLTFATAPARWWALIPGFTLLGLGALVALGELAPPLGEAWGGGLFLGGIGLGFCAVYLTGRERWWALIPGGVLLTLALVASLSAAMPGRDLGWLFFLGLGLTFGIVAVVPTPRGRMSWALFPSGVLLAMALLGMAFTGEAVGIFWPVVMIVAGLFLAFRSLRNPEAGQNAGPQLAEAVTTIQSAAPESEIATHSLLHDDLPLLERVAGEEAVLEDAHKEAL